MDGADGNSRPRAENGHPLVKCVMLDTRVCSLAYESCDQHSSLRIRRSMCESVSIFRHRECVSRRQASGVDWDSVH